MKKIFTLFFLLASLFSFSQSTTVVISQVYGGGGANTGTPTYKNDYVELHNVSNTTQSLNGMSIQYGSSSGNFGSTATNIYAFPNGTSIPAGGYLLIQLGAAGTAGADLPVPADLVTTNLTMSAASGKVALINQTTAPGCGATATPCTLPNPLYIDVVSYGASNNGEGGTTVNNGVALSNTQGAVRKNNGCTDTDNNNADFDVITNPVPRNSASPINNCSAVVVPTPTVTSISPNSATAGGPGFTLTVNGTNFVSGQSTVTWNGSPRTTTFVSSTQLTATIPASDIASAGTANVGVTTTGAASPSNTVVFTINAAVTPTLSATALTGFGNVCTNTTAGPNSFTITGSNLTAADITVGPLAGYTFSTTSGGTYTSTLTLNQTGGSYSQQVFVKFTPTAVQSYAGNISVSGGGASTINVAATGSGVNTAPSVTTGTATSITTTSATAPGSITATGCTAITAYGIEYSTTNGFANGAGTQVPSSNLSGGNFSSNLSTLLPGTTYYYKAYATNGAGTTYGTQQSFTTVSVTPLITTTVMGGFGSVCTNTTAGPNSFTINGTNLTNANITVGPLAGYTFSTTSGGTYTSSLTLTQPGGNYSQQVFVKFNPTAVQSYNGNIPVSGGGSPSTTVSVSGAGVNTATSVTTGAASNITFNSATAAGTITATGCTAVTAYGIEYSTTSGFANGTGTQVASTNLLSGAFTSNLTGLASSTTYYFKAFATNAGGTSYGAQQSFTTSAAPPATLSATTLTAFGSGCVGVTSAANSFTITGNNLVAGNITVGPLAGYAFSTTANGTYTNSLTIPTTAGSFSQQVFVKFTPTSATAFNGNIPVSGGGATAINVAASGTGVNTPPAVTTGAASNITTSSAVVSGTVTAAGCSSTTDYGIEYSGINNFVGGTGTKVSAGSSITTGAYSVNLTGLVQGATYYYRAYATSAGGTTYGALQSFTVTAIPNAFTVYPVPVQRGHNLNFSMNNLKPGFYGIVLINSAGQEVFKKAFNIQVNFINDHITIPYTIPDGVYRVRIYNTTDIIDLKTILVKE